MTKFSAFLKDEAGAVTVDWVVLTAAVVGLGMVIFAVIAPAVNNLTNEIGAEMNEATAVLAADN